jgi:hypothetical protein
MLMMMMLWLSWRGAHKQRQDERAWLQVFLR